MLQSPLSVRLSAPGGERDLDVRDLSFSRTARGGYESATFDLPEWVTTADPAISAEARCRISDGRSARTVWEGYLGQPGKSVTDSDGHVWQMGAIGSQSVLGDRSKAYIVIDRGLDGWERSTEITNAINSARAEVSQHPNQDDKDAVVMQMPAGVPVANLSLARMQYRRIDDAGQMLGGFGFNANSGLSTANWEMQSRAGGGGGGFITVHADAASTTIVNHSARWNVHWSGSDKTLVGFRWQRVSGGVTNVGTDDNWAAFYDIHVVAKLFGQDGAGVTTPGTIYSDGLVPAHVVVVDALQWFTNQIDIAAATIDTSFTHQIDQLAYPDGVRLPQVFDDLALLEPDMTWQVGPANAAGKHSFTLGRYPSTVRYEADTRDGWTQPGGESQLANSLPVIWTDPRGNDQLNTYTQAVAALDQWGRVRDAEPIHLGAEVGSQAAADRIGSAYLAQLAQVQAAGTLTVARPILDMYAGRWVKPWEIEPGYLVNVRDTGLPPMRLSEMSYRDSDQAASLTLGTPVYSLEELVNRLAGRRTRKGGARAPLAVA